MMKQLVLLALFVAGASATRQLRQAPISNSSFGEVWIREYGYDLKTYRFYLAEDAVKWASKPGYALDLAAQRASFQADFGDLLSQYYQIYPSRIHFVSDQQPARSWLRVPNTNQRDVRAFIDCQIEVPRDPSFTTYPKDVTRDSAFLLGAGDNAYFVAKWNIGLALCDPLDPDYAFTYPFPGTCDRVQSTDCQNRFPLCNRVVEVIPLGTPTPDVTGYHFWLTPSASQLAILLADGIATYVPTSLRRLMGAIADKFRIDTENSMSERLMQQLPGAGAIQVHVTAIGHNPSWMNDSLQLTLDIDLENSAEWTGNLTATSALARKLQEAGQLHDTGRDLLTIDASNTNITYVFKRCEDDYSVCMTPWYITAYGLSGPFVEESSM